MQKDRMKVIVAGKSGDGATRTVGDTLAPVLARLNLLAHQTYLDVLSVIMSPDPISTTFPIGRHWVSPGDEEYDVLISLEDDSYKPNPAHPKNPLWDIKPNRASIVKFGSKLVEGSCIIYDSSKNIVAVEKLIDDFEAKKINIFPIPATALAKDIGLPQASNILMVGALFGLMDLQEGLEILKEILRRKFSGKGEDVVLKNIQAAEKGFEEVKKNIASRNINLGFIIKPPPENERKKYATLSGNDAFCLGALAAGCRFMAGYPISPATPQLVFMSRWMSQYKGVCHQASSEIAAIHEVIGAAAAGVRAYTATSGPGFSLMIEGIGHASAMEVPVVICVCQRQGPDTGAPTKSQQADLNLARAGSHGDVQMIVLAPSNHEECFTLAVEALNLAEIYQCPVIVLMDQTLAEGRKLMSLCNFAEIKIDRGRLITKPGLEEKFMRYQFTSDGISPRAVLGTESYITKMIGSEHTEQGAIIATGESIKLMNDKRAKKMETYLKNHFLPPKALVNIWQTDLILVGWGSTKDVLCEVAERLEKKGVAARVIHFTHLWPLDKKRVRKFFPRGVPIVAVEGNLTGQFADQLESILHRSIRRVNKYSGKPFEPQEIVTQVEEKILNRRKR